MRIKNIDLLLIITIELINMVWTLRSGHMLIIGVFLAFPLVFLFPGYTLIEVLYYKQPPEVVRRLALSLGLSIAMDILSGFLLNMLPAGLNAKSWAIYLGTVTIFLSLVAVLLRGKSSTNGVWPWLIRLDVRKHCIACLLLILTIGMIALAFLYSRHSALTSKRPGFTEFWMIPSDKDKTGCSVLLGIQSFEFITIHYHILVTVNGAQTNRWLPAVLAPQKVWVTTLPIHSYVNNSALIVAQLYRSDQPKSAYRNVHLLLYRHSAKGGAQCSVLNT
jgi:uncharacterized membrane protein